MCGVLPLCHWDSVTAGEGVISMRLISNFVWESLPLSCRCAIGVLALMRMETLYSVSFGNARTQAGDAVSMLD